MESVVNEFPPPPLYYKQFINEDNLFLPPEIPEIIETYGGSIPTLSINEEDPQTSHLLPKQLKKVLNELIQVILYFATDKNKREPIETGVTNMELLVNQIYDILKKYRTHEARENICILLRKELEELTESRDYLERTYNEIKQSLEE